MATLLAVPASAHAQDARRSCSAAAEIAEREASLPPGLLLAIGRVETGRADPASGRVEPWPWSTNAMGSGHYFTGSAEAIAWTAAELAAGDSSIDIGCFQINLRSHPAAFATLEDGFDPVTNARYAASFLMALYRQAGSWEAATARYHSADPARGSPYSSQVFASLGRIDLPAPLLRPLPSFAASGNTFAQGFARGGGITIVFPQWATPVQGGGPLHPGLAPGFGAPIRLGRVGHMTGLGLPVIYRPSAPR